MTCSLWAQDSNAASHDPYLAPDCILSAVLTPSPKPDAAFKALLEGMAADAAPGTANDTGEAVGTGGPRMTLPLIETMAARGLTLDEIASLLGQPLPTDADQRLAVEAAWRRGRHVGLARIKDANFQAALKGGVTAQKQVLDLLRAPSTSDNCPGSGGVTVVRRVLEAGDDEG